MKRKIVDKRTVDLVYRLMLNNEHLRDDDHKLIASVWYHEAGIKDNAEMSAFAFLRLVAENNVLTSAKAIERTRRKVQEEHPETRGKKYDTRKKYARKTRRTINDPI